MGEAFLTSQAYSVSRGGSFVADCSTRQSSLFSANNRSRVCVVKGGPQHINYDEKPFSSASLPCVYFITQFLSSHTAMCEETGPQLQNNLITLRASLCEGVDSHSDQMVHSLPARFRAAYLSRRKLTLN